MPLARFIHCRLFHSSWGSCVYCPVGIDVEWRSRDLCADFMLFLRWYHLMLYRSVGVGVWRDELRVVHAKSRFNWFVVFKNILWYAWPLQCTLLWGRHCIESIWQQRLKCQVDMRSWHRCIHLCYSDTKIWSSLEFLRDHFGSVDHYWLFTT